MDTRPVDEIRVEGAVCVAGVLVGLGCALGLVLWLAWDAGIRVALWLMGGTW